MSFEAAEGKGGIGKEEENEGKEKSLKRKREDIVDLIPKYVLIINLVYMCYELLKSV